MSTDRGHNEQQFLNNLLAFRKHQPLKTAFSVSRENSASDLSLRVPTTKDEEWKYTNLRPLYREHFVPYFEADSAITVNELQGKLIPESEGARLVFVNGTYSEDLSSVDSTTTGIELMTFTQAWEKYPEKLRDNLGKHAIIHNDPFIPFNEVFLRDGIFISIAGNTSNTKPVHLLYVSTEHTEDYFEIPRTLILAGQNSRSTIVEDYLGLGEGTYLTLPVTEIALEEGATLTHIRWQRESGKAFHINRVGTSLARNSHYDSYSIQLGSRIARNDVYAFLNDREIDCTLDGLVLAGDNQLSDTHTMIDHRMPYCTSHQLHKCIIEGTGHSVFNGKIYVHKDAQKTDSFQENRNLLLSDKGKVDTKPQLEIFADDVKCSHGATVGQLEADEVFYLKSRGLSEETARELLSYGFALEIIENVPVESVRKQLIESVKKFTIHSQAVPYNV